MLVFSIGAFLVSKWDLFVAFSSKTQRKLKGTKKPLFHSCYCHCMQTWTERLLAINCACFSLYNFISFYVVSYLLSSVNITLGYSTLDVNPHTWYQRYWHVARAWILVLVLWHMHEFWHGYLKKGVFTLVPSENEAPLVWVSRIPLIFFFKYPISP